MEEYREVQCVMGQMHLGGRGFREGPHETLQLRCTPGRGGGRGTRRDLDIP